MDGERLKMAKIPHRCFKSKESNREEVVMQEKQRACPEEYFKCGVDAIKKRRQDESATTNHVPLDLEASSQR